MEVELNLVWHASHGYLALDEAIVEERLDEAVTPRYLHPRVELLITAEVLIYGQARIPSRRLWLASLCHWGSVFYRKFARSHDLDLQAFGR